MRPLITKTHAGWVTEPPPVPNPEELYLYWPLGTLATFWWFDHQGIKEQRTIDTGWTFSNGGYPNPGTWLARRAAVQFRAWPNRLDYVFLERFGVSPNEVHHIDVVNQTHQVLTRPYGLAGNPYAHTDGAFYWREGDENGQALVRWNPSTPTPEVVTTIAYAGSGSFEANGEAAHRDVFVIADRSPVVHLVSYATGAVETRPRSTFFTQRTTGLGVPPAPEADRLSGSIGGSWDCPSSSGAEIRGSWLSDGSGYLADIQPGSSGTADDEISSAPLYVAGHFDLSRTRYMVYPFKGAGTGGDPYRTKVFNLALDSDAPENSDENQGTGVPQPLIDGDWSTQPHQVWPWGDEAS